MRHSTKQERFNLYTLKTDTANIRDALQVFASEFMRFANGASASNVLVTLVVRNNVFEKADVRVLDGGVKRKTHEITTVDLEEPAPSEKADSDAAADADAEDLNANQTAGEGCPVENI